MGEKKEIKVSLGTVICLFIIVILLFSIVGMWYYFTQIKPNETNNNATTNQFKNTAVTETKINEVSEANNSNTEIEENAYESFSDTPIWFSKQTDYDNQILLIWR